MGAEEIAWISYRVRKDQGQKLPLLLPIFKTKIEIEAFLSMAWSLTKNGVQRGPTGCLCKVPVQNPFHTVLLGLLYLPGEDTEEEMWGGRRADQRGR